MTARSIIFALTAIALLSAGAARAADPVSFETVRSDGYVRIKMVFPDSLAEQPIAAEAAVDNEVLVARFNRAVSGDPAPILSNLGAEAAMARLDPDGRVLRVALRMPARAHVSHSYNVIAIDLLPPEAEDPPDIVSPREQSEIEAAARAAAAPPPPPPEPDPPLEVEVGRASSAAFERVTLRWPEPVSFQTERREPRVRIAFERDAILDLAPIRADLPRHLEGLTESHVNGKLILSFDLAEGADLSVRQDGALVTIDLTGGDSDLNAIAALEEAARRMNAEDPEEARQEQYEADRLVLAAEPREPTLFKETEAVVHAAPERNPVPASGVVPIRGVALGGDLLMRFDWAAPVPAAAFRRGEAIWIVFAAEADLDAGELLRGHRRHILDIDQFTGEGYTALRITAPPSTLIEARTEEGRQGWTFALSNRIETPPLAVTLLREATGRGPGRLLAALPDAGPVFNIPDPDAGDEIAVVTALQPPRGLIAGQDFLELTALSTAHGLAFVLLADDVVITPEAERVALERPRGLALSPTSAGRAAVQTATRRGTAAPVSPAYIDFDGWKADQPFIEAESALERRIATDPNDDSYMAMARFLLAYELPQEALGALDLALSHRPQLEIDSHFLAMRGAANYMAGRYDEAGRDLTAPVLDRDSAAQLWRGMLALEGEDWDGAREYFERGREAFYLFSPEWRARFRAGYARAALKLNDLATAKSQLELAEAEAPRGPLEKHIELARAGLAESLGRHGEAAATYDRLSMSGDEAVEARAILARAQMDLETGSASPDEAIDRLEALRFRWRGDDVELETSRTLGKLYVEKGDYQRGLSVMHAAMTRFPESPVARRISGDMSTIFRNLFLEGEAERLDPVEALALYYEFSELTPIGADGDRMIRRLAERLVAFDLLAKAAELLQHQVDNRLREPVARAQVAADLALIYLMDRRPESALRTLRSTRVSRLPDALTQERRVIEARALAELGAAENALELLEGDRSLEAARLRADIAWQSRNWENAGKRLEEFLGDGLDDGSTVPTAEQESAILRAAVAYSLAGDQAALTRLSGQYRDAMDKTGSASAFRAVTGRVETEGLALAEIAQRVSDTSDLEAFLDSRRGRLEGDEPRMDYAPPANEQAVADAGGASGG
ncbi:MAG: hypothetical protein H2040_10880 [Euryhalocaulis sp.]|uniref:tetratricopeptide repeat protein n=1 Tax=Euryhalocaulis sp. TaxID=2744307 RepID=UPI0018022778|nr:hypothetical protein [Euryhalocaulis sp.]MBA4802356.1 hypothetical protein [Euryhalocaulis sp.]